MLFAAGWTLDDVLDLSWSQMTTVVSCVLSYKIEQANVVAQSVTSMFGGKVDKKYRKQKTPSRKKREKMKDNQLLNAFASAGLNIN